MKSSKVAINSYLVAEEPRIAGLVPRFLEPVLDRSWEILSIGCGAGADVVELRRLGYQAFGLDPSRLKLDAPPPAMRPYFRIGTAEDLPFGDKQFDFVFALDVIEHVGCEDFGTRLKPDTFAMRSRFLKSCMQALKPGGQLLLTTSNKLFPIDIGHWHKYHRLGAAFPNRKKLGLSIPWSKKNFLLSQKDFHALFSDAVGPQGYTLDLVPTARYPKISARKGLVPALVRTAFNLADTSPLIGSPVSPLLIVRATRRP